MFIAFSDSVTFTTIIFIKFGAPKRQLGAGKDLIGPQELFVKEEVKVFMSQICTTIPFIYHLPALIHCSWKKSSIWCSSWYCQLLSWYCQMLSLCFRLTWILLEAIMIWRNCLSLSFYFAIQLHARIEFWLFINLKWQYYFH